MCTEDSTQPDSTCVLRIEYMCTGIEYMCTGNLVNTKSISIIQSGGEIACRAHSTCVLRIVHSLIVHVY